MLNFIKKNECKHNIKSEKPDKNIPEIEEIDGKIYKMQDKNAGKPTKPEGSDKIWHHQV